MTRGAGRRDGDMWRRFSYGGSAPLWTPADITLPVLFTYEEQHTNVSGACSAWIEEFAAKSALQGTAGNRPAITTANGIEVIDFELTNANFLSTTPATITGGVNVLTIAFIGTLESVAGIQKIVETNTGGAGSFALFQEGTKLAVYAGGAAGQDYVWGDTTLLAATRYLFVVEIPFSTLTTDVIKSWVNNVAQTQTPIVATATNTTMITSAYTMGKWIAAGLQYWDGEMDILRGWNGSFDATTRANLYAWAKRVYLVA